MAHLEASALINAVPADVFSFVDDHGRFSSHMNQSSWMLGGGRMSLELDAARGQAVGSHIRMGAQLLGIRLFLDEVVTFRDPPIAKVWATVDPVRLLVIGRYTMGVQIAAVGSRSRLRVFIDYELPAGRVARVMGMLFGRAYARWCVDQMLKGVVERFGATSQPQAVAPARASE
jgi:hypothetical protein